MKGAISFSFAAVAALFTASMVSAGERTSEGCFSSSTGLTMNSSITFNSKGSCGDACQGIKSIVFATKNSTCWCGDTLPPASMKAADSECSTACPGYPSDICGGTLVWSVYLTGLSGTAANVDAAASDTSTSASKTSTTAPASTASSKPSVVTMNGQTIIVTATAAASTATNTAVSSNSNSSSPSKAGIAVGVVVGLVAIAAIAGGIFLFVRNRKRREVEEEYRRNAAVSSFIAGGKAPGSSGANSFTDTRLEPAIMAGRRMSDGSIADNQDYSRRILKVTNA